MHALPTLLPGDDWVGDPADDEVWVDDGCDAAPDADTGAESAAFPVAGLLPGDLDAP